MSTPEYTIASARYAKGMLAVSCPSTDGYKTRAARLCEHVGGRWSNRESAYIMSPAKVARFQGLHDDGRDASAFTGKLYEVLP